MGFPFYAVHFKESWNPLIDNVLVKMAMTVEAV